MHYSRLSVLSLVAAAHLGIFGGLATPLPSSWGEILTKHEWTHIPVNWVTLGHPPDGASIDLHIALKSDREEALTDALLEVSQPGSPKYRAHLTRQQVAQLVAPHPDTFELVTSWLKHNGVSPSSISTTHGGCWLTVAGVPVSQANQLLRASYQLYHHPEKNETILRTVRYALPAALHIHVKTIAPTTAFTSGSLLQHETPRNRSGGAVNVTSGESVGMLSRQPPNEIDITPSVLRSQYKFTIYNPGAITRNSLGIVGFRNQAPMIPDVSWFMETFREDTRHDYLEIKQIDTRYPTQFGFQATLDTEYGLGLVSPTPVVYYVSTDTGTRIDETTYLPDPGDEYVQILRFLIDKPNTPRTISLGYGTSELSMPSEYAEALCHLFAQLGARGISVLVASGDVGVGLGNCINAFGGVQFYTVFPASCPWVTSVGGTMLTGDLSKPNSLWEVAHSISGGGFSAYFPRHDYQNTAVEAYLAEGYANEFAGYFDPLGRAVPDIALLSSRYTAITTDRAMIADGPYHAASGTSCSTISSASVITLLNDYLILSGEAPLGFLNPWLYTIGWMGFNDIIIGRNPGCRTFGFTAQAGWDPVTGYGSPDFPVLQGLASFRVPYPFPPPKARNESFP